MRDVRAVIAANRVTEIFNVLDTDGDGTINKRLLSQVLTQLGGEAFAGKLSQAAGGDCEPRVRIASFLTFLFGEGAAPAVQAAQYLKVHGVAEPREEDIQYLEEHGLVQLVGDLLRRWLELKPADPKRFAAEHFVDGQPLPGAFQPFDTVFGSGAASSSSSAAEVFPGPISPSNVAGDLFSFAAVGGKAPEVTVIVSMAASGQHVCDVRLPGDASVWQLKQAIRHEYKEVKSCFQQKLIVGARVLADTELVHDVFPDAKEGGACNAQLICQPSEEFVEELREFRKKLSAPNDPPIQQAIDAGVVPRFIQYLKETTWPQLQFEAGWALTNICSGSTNQTRVVVDDGAVPVFIELLRSPDIEVRGQAIWALGNIAGDSPQLRDIVLREGALEPTLEMLRTMEPATVENTAWALSNYIRGQPRPPFGTIEPAVAVFASCVQRTEDEKCLNEMSWGLSYIAGLGDDAIREIIKTGVARRMVDLLQHPSSMVKTPALRTLGMLVSGDDKSTQAVLDVGLMPGISRLMDHTEGGIRKEVCLMLSNMTAGTQAQIQAVIDAGLVPRLLDAIRHERAATGRKAACAIHNIVDNGGTDAQVSYVVQQCDFLHAAVTLFENGEAKVVAIALDMIKAALTLPNRRKQQNREVRDIALDLNVETHCRTVLEQNMRRKDSKVFRLAKEVLSLLGLEVDLAGDDVLEALSDESGDEQSSSGGADSSIVEEDDDEAEAQEEEGAAQGAQEEAAAEAADAEEDLPGHPTGQAAVGVLGDQAPAP